MTTRITNRIANTRTNNSHISNNKEEIEIIEYGLTCIFNLLTPVILLIAFSSFTHNLLYLPFWIISFLTVRSFIGGYHAPPQNKCLFFSTSIGIISMMLIPNLIPHLKYITISIALICLFIIKGPILQDISYSSKRLYLYIGGILTSTITLSIAIISRNYSNNISNSIYLGLIVAYILYTIELIKREK